MSTTPSTYNDLQKTKAALLQMLNETQQNIAKTQGMEGAIDIHHPELSPNWPRYKHQEFPKMLYHPFKLDPQTETARNGVRLRNEKNPTLAPLDLPASKPMTVIIKNTATAQEELEKYLAAGWLKAPPVLVSEEAEVEHFDPLTMPVANPALCGRGCGNPRHRGACPAKATAEAAV